MSNYKPLEIEEKWQKIWDEKHCYKVEVNSKKKKIFMSLKCFPTHLEEFIWGI